MQGRNGRKTYARAIIAHSAGSVLSGAAMGGALGVIGRSLFAPATTAWYWLALSSVATILALREFGRIDFPIPQRSRQTAKTWYGRFGPIGAAWWWGVDLGSGLTTIVTFSGYWLLAITAVMGGSPVYGALVIGLYGLGRASSVWLTPMVMGPILPSSLGELLAIRPHLHRWHARILTAVAFALALRTVVTFS